MEINPNYQLLNRSSSKWSILNIKKDCKGNEFYRIFVLLSYFLIFFSFLFPWQNPNRTWKNASCTTIELTTTANQDGSLL
jgi:hypothetical protein